MVKKLSGFLFILPNITERKNYKYTYVVKSTEKQLTLNIYYKSLKS